MFKFIYTCLACVFSVCVSFANEQTYNGLVKREIKEKLINTGKLKYIYKDFPLDLPAMLAAMVTNCYEGNF